MLHQQDLLINKLIEKLHDVDPLVRRNAAGALRMHGTRAIDALPSLRALTADADPRVRQEAEHAVERLGSLVSAHRFDARRSMHATR